MEVSGHDYFVGTAPDQLLDFGLWTLDLGLRSLYPPGRAHQFTLHFVENAIDEFAAVLSGKFFGDVHRLIDADHRWDVVAMKHLIDGEAENISVHGRHAVQVPV